jgi:CubicO group peptidase (beta-lactamase class C family)
MDLTTRVDAVLDAALGSRIVGCVVLVHIGGERVYARAAGFADREAGKPVREDTIFRLASVTKPIVAAAALRLIDLGLLALDDPVTKYLPFFTPKAPDGSTPVIRIRHLLTHTSGLSYEAVPDDVSRGSDPMPLFPLEENLRRLARSTLAFVPGQGWAYGMSTDVLGGVVGAVNGDISDVEGALLKYVTGPLQMSDTRFGVTDPARLCVPYGDGSPAPIRMAEPQAMVSPFTGNVQMMSPGRIFQPGAAQSGGSGMAGTAADFMRLLDAVIVGDFLRPATRQAAVTNQAGPHLTGRRAGEQFGFLSAVITDAKAAGWPREGMLRWGGVWGNNWAADPRTGTNMVVFTNTMWEGGDGKFRDEMRDAVFV